jgi:EAL domain-containing protein (putative c-di-GMP-specific phosphodiesterase class I)/GGDEF domain-containing protein
VSSDSYHLPPDELEIYAKEKLDLGLEVFVRDNQLAPTFQSIFDLKNQDVLGFEGIPPIELMRAAKVSSTVLEGEYMARHIVLEKFTQQALSGKVFLRVSLDVLLQSAAKSGETLKYLAEFGLSPSNVVIKLSKSESTEEYQLLRQATQHYRGMGFQIAVSNLNQGFTGLSLWSEIMPDYVQLEQVFLDGISHDKVKQHIARSIYEVASQSGAKIIAEGISSHQDLMAIRDLGIDFVQGDYLAPSSYVPSKTLSAEVRQSLLRFEYKHENVLQSRASVAKLLQYVAPVSPQINNAAVFELFEANPKLYAVPVVDLGRPVGLITRHTMIDNYARPYRRELYSNKSCTSMMDSAPIIVNHEMSVFDLNQLILNSDPQHLASGYIITDQGLYLGMGNGHDLLRLISKMQVDAARYANPLTLLPGNTPVSEQMDLLIGAGASFVTCYFDLDNFKPFNDVYGFQKGDEVIQLTARLLSKVCGIYDFLGHIGGDDFIVLFQSDDWEQRCHDFMDEIAKAFPYFYGDEDRARGGIETDDRQGIRRFYPILTISIASLKVTPGLYKSHHEVSAACTSAKKHAKKFEGNYLFIERRLPLSAVSTQPDHQLH